MHIRKDEYHKFIAGIRAAMPGIIDALTSAELEESGDPTNIRGKEIFLHDFSMIVARLLRGTFPELKKEINLLKALGKCGGVSLGMTEQEATNSCARVLKRQAESDNLRYVSTRHWKAVGFLVEGTAYELDVFTCEYTGVVSKISFRKRIVVAKDGTLSEPTSLQVNQFRALLAKRGKPTFSNTGSEIWQYENYNVSACPAQCSLSIEPLLGLATSDTSITIRPEMIYCLQPSNYKSC